ncbi:thioesterase family protein [Nocardioides gilvus]|uniref:thioesterase family protein n=1 Tax=Nocardioides gilvus TaxID=1735589 RepID=UPI000D74A325|nr:thioesterase family protein [Nocardioides gilvus]
MNLYLRLIRLLVGLRSRRRTQLWEETVTPFRVWPSDLDALGHMNNAKYLALTDLGRVDMMVRSGFWSRVSGHGWYAVVAAQTIRYRRSLKPWERFELRSRMIGFDERAMYVEQVFTVAGEVAATAIVQCRFLKKAGGHVSPAELRALVPGAPEQNLPDWILAWAEGVRQGP